jgi:hypothetical protein
LRSDGSLGLPHARLVAQVSKAQIYLARIRISDTVFG